MVEEVVRRDFPTRHKFLLENFAIYCTLKRPYKTSLPFLIFIMFMSFPWLDVVPDPSC